VTFSEVTARQRSEAWHHARLGRLTGSNAAKMLAKVKTGEAAGRRDYRMQLACERLTGASGDSGFSNDAMARGVELEPIARAAYELATGEVVRESGFLSVHDLKVGCSLDGHVGNYRLIQEIKCMNTAAHLAVMRSRKIPPKHVAQCRHNLWVTSAEVCDFVTFDDRLPEHLRLFIVRLRRADAAIDDYEAEALKFLAEVDAEEAALRGMENLTHGL